MNAKVFPKLPDFYMKYIIKNKIVFELTFKINKDNKNNLKILDGEFITKYKNKINLIYNNIDTELKEYFAYTDNNNN